MFWFLSFQMAMADQVEGLQKKRDYLMETNLRYRHLFIPDFFIDPYAFDEDVPGANPFKRPSIKASSVALEYAFRQDLNVGTKIWSIYFEYISNNMEPGYWDDVERNIETQHEDGFWVHSENFGGWFVGGDYNYALNLTPTDRDLWLSLLFTGGLGVGFIQGDLAYWEPGSNQDENDPNSCFTDAPAYVRKDYCQPDARLFSDGIDIMEPVTDDQGQPVIGADGEPETAPRNISIPRVIPMLTLGIGMQVNLADRGHIRFETGFHDLLFWGASYGISF